MYEYLIQLSRIKIFALKTVSIVCVLGVCITAFYISISPMKIDEYMLPIAQNAMLAMMFSESFSYFKSRIQSGSMARDASFPLPGVVKMLIHILSSLTMNLAMFLIAYHIIKPIAVIKMGYLPLAPTIATIITTTIFGVAFAVVSNIFGIFAQIASAAGFLFYEQQMGNVIILHGNKQGIILQACLLSGLLSVAIIFLLGRAMDVMAANKAKNLQ